MTDRQTIKNGEDTLRMEYLRAEKRFIRLNIRRYMDLIDRQRFINNIYFAIIVILVIALIHISITFSGRSVSTEPHYDKVDIHDLRVITENDNEIKVIIDFSTIDGREYNFEFSTPEDDISVKALTDILEDWNDDSKYIMLDYDIITKIQYNALLDKVDTSKKVVINNSAAFVKQAGF